MLLVSSHLQGEKVELRSMCGHCSDAVGAVFDQRHLRDATPPEAVLFVGKG